MKLVTLLFLVIWSVVKSMGQTASQPDESQHTGPLGHLSSKPSIDSLVNTLMRKGEFRTTLVADDTLLLQRALKLNVKEWETTDLNGDGRTDLLLNGHGEGSLVLTVLDMGKNRFVLQRVPSMDWDETLFARPVQLGKGFGILLLRRHSWGFWQEESPIKLDTLVLRNGVLVEFSNADHIRSVRSIHFETTQCFGKCPVFALSIEASGQATYEAIHYNDKKGRFKGRIDVENLAELVDLVDYLSLPRLDSSYAVRWTDDQSCTLTVTYDDGSTAKISDYGLSGTYGLRHLYRLLFALRENQKWRRSL